MKKLGAILVSGLLSFSFGTEVRAQMQPVPPSVSGSRYAHPAGVFNPDTMVTFRGQVLEVRRNVPKREGGTVTMQLVVQADTGTVTVQMGPANFVDQKIALAAGDLVEIRGSSLAGPRGGNIIAADIWKGGTHLRLRDEMGNPLWGGGKGRPGY